MQRIIIACLGMLISGVLYAEPDCTPAWKPDLNDDGLVNYKDLWIVGHGFGLPKQDRRRIFARKGDINCDDKIDDLDWQYVWQNYNKNYPVYPQASIFPFELPEKLFVGDTVNLESDVRMSSKKPFNVKLSYQITPPQGLSLKQPLPNQQINVAKISVGSGYFWAQSFNTAIKGDKEGKYQITARVEVPETGRLLEEKTAVVHVISKRKPLLNIALSFTPYYKIKDLNVYYENKDPTYNPESEYYLIANLKLTGKDAEHIESIEIIDETDRNYSYPGNQYPKPIRIMILHDFFQDRKCKSLHALVHTLYGDVTGDSVKICGTPIPRKDMLQDCSLCHEKTPHIKGHKHNW